MEEDINKELKEERDFPAFYRSFPQVEGLVRIFFRQDQYLFGVHGHEAELIANEFLKCPRLLKYWRTNASQPTTPPSKKLKSSNSNNSSDNNNSSNTGLACLALKEKQEIAMVLSYLLFGRKWRVELWRKPNNDNNNNSNSNAGWQIYKTASPGNTDPIEELLSESLESLDKASRLSSVVLAVHVSKATTQDTGNVLLGVAFADLSKRALYIVEFLDGNNFLVFESLLVQVGACEGLLLGANNASSLGFGAEITRLQSIFEKLNIPTQPRKVADMRDDNIEQDLKNLLGESQGKVALAQFNASPVTMQALSCVVNYLELLNDETNLGKYTLNQYTLNQYMRLDYAAIHALNLLPEDANSTNGPKSAVRTSSYLFGFLDRCKTAMGKRLLMQWIRQPLLDPTQIRMRQDIVSLLLDDLNLRKELVLLSYVPDLDKLLKRILGKRASLKDCYSLYVLVNLLPKFVECLNSSTCTINSNASPAQLLLSSRFIQPLEKLHRDSLGIIKMVETFLDIESILQKGEYLIRPDFDEPFQRLHQEKQKIEDALKRHVTQLLDQANVKGLTTDAALKYNRRKGWAIKVTNVQRSAITKVHSNLQIVMTSKKKNGLRDPFMEDRTEKYQKVVERYEKRQQGIIARALEVLSSYTKMIEQSSQLFAELDVLLSYSEVCASSTNPYTKPELLPPGQAIELIQSRHPCLEVQEEALVDSQSQFIPNDVSLREGKSKFTIVTGPNMGGKSTYIRQVAVIVHMCQIGMFVPAESAKISIVDAILARVGASDSQMRGVSTFMMEMLEMSNMLQIATPHSLLIVDELGRGTSTADGFGLAKAISQHIIIHLKSFCLFATHFHELTHLEKEYKEVANLHVEAMTNSEGDLILLHTVKEGPALRSYGIQIAQLAQFPKHITDLAKKKLVQLESFDQQQQQQHQQR